MEQWAERKEVEESGERDDLPNPVEMGKKADIPTLTASMSSAYEIDGEREGGVEIAAWGKGVLRLE